MPTRRPSVLSSSLRLAIAAAAASALLAAPSAFAQESWPRQLQAQMVRVARIGWALNAAAGEQCAGTTAPIGTEFDFIGAYPAASHAFVAQELRLPEAPVVIAVEPGGPADEAGVRTGDAILMLDGETWQAIGARAASPDLLADDLQTRSARPPAEAPLTLTVQRATQRLTLTVKRRAGCAVRYIVKTNGGIAAWSDASNVAVSSALVNFADNDDELALVLAHELAHILRGDRRGQSLARRRESEDRADLAGARLAHCAGFDVARGVRFFRRRDAGRWFRFLDAPTHRRMKARAASIEAEAPTRAAAPCRPASLTP